MFEVTVRSTEVLPWTDEVKAARERKGLPRYDSYECIEVVQISMRHLKTTLVILRMV